MSAAQAGALSPTERDADRQLKTKHRALWASGDYPAVAAELIADLGPRLVQACAVRPGQRVLDIAAGSGNAAIPAARGLHRQALRDDEAVRAPAPARLEPAAVVGQ